MKPATLPAFEGKFIDNFTTAAAPAAGAIMNDSLLDAIQRGTGESERVGRRIQVTGLLIRWTVRNAAALAAEVANTVRFMVVQDKQSNGTAATTALVLASTVFNSFNNLDNSHRFRTLFEKTMSLNQHALGTIIEESGDAFIKLNMPVLYDATAGAITDLTSNNIFLMAIASQVGTTVTFSTRVRYTDA